MTPLFLLKHNTKEHDFYMTQLPNSVAPVAGWWFIAFRTLEDAREAMKIAISARGDDNPLADYHPVEFLNKDFWQVNSAYFRSLGVKGAMIIKGMNHEFCKLEQLNEGKDPQDILLG